MMDIGLAVFGIVPRAHAYQITNVGHAFVPLFPIHIHTPPLHHFLDVGYINYRYFYLPLPLATIKSSSDFFKFICMQLTVKQFKRTQDAIPLLLSLLCRLYLGLTD